MKLTARQRLEKTLNHENPGKVVVEFGATLVTGIHAQAITKLREFYGLEKRTVRVDDPYFLLGTLDEDLRRMLPMDVVGVGPHTTVHGYENNQWMTWKTPSGVEVEITAGLAIETDSQGRVYLYPQGDKSARPSSVMMPDGYFFDPVTRVYDEFDPGTSNAREDFKDDCKVLNEEQLRHLEDAANDCYNNTECGILCSVVLLPAGDMGVIQGPGIKEPRGLRRPEDWLMAYYTAPEYVKDCFAFETEIALKNAELIMQAAGNKIQVILGSSTDFGTQRAPYISPDLYREFYFPYHKKVNDWIHEHTQWKVFYHSCGSVSAFFEDFHKAGMDILNPVQYTAAGMDSQTLKDKWGKVFTFWGGGVDTQSVLPFGTPEEVYEETMRQLSIFAPGGGFVFSAVHNVQAPTSPENLDAMFRAVKDYGSGKRQP